MRRLIDADVLAERLMNAWDCESAGSVISAVMADVVVPICVSTPTVDAVEVVRCKDCKHADKCSRNVAMQDTYQMYEKIDYCSYGERKDHEQRINI